MLDSGQKKIGMIIDVDANAMMQSSVSQLTPFLKDPPENTRYLTITNMTQIITGFFYSLSNNKDNTDKSCQFKHFEAFKVLC